VPFELQQQTLLQVARGHTGRILLGDGTIFWTGTHADAVRPTGPFDPQLPVYDIKPLDVQIDESLLTERLVFLLSISFGGLAALLNHQLVFLPKFFHGPDAFRGFLLQLAIRFDQLLVLHLQFRTALFQFLRPLRNPQFQFFVGLCQLLFRAAFYSCFVLFVPWFNIVDDLQRVLRG